MNKIFKTVKILLLIVFASPIFSQYSLKDMTLEEKIGQLLMVHFNGEEANQDSKILIQDLHVGGIIYYNWANGLNSPKQVFSLSTSLQNLAKENKNSIPLLIAADQEGGLVARLKNGFTIFPGNKALAMTNNPKLAKKSSFIMGKELKAVGINMNLAPVVDINNNPKNPVIGIRSFGSSPQTVILFAKHALKGYKKAGLITCLKHFPGHGDVEIDSHKNLPIVSKSKEELLKNELLPFKTLANSTDAIMTAHIIMQAFDSKNCATLSKNILTYLREEMEFKGIIISDSLVMEGLLKNCSSIENAAVKAINAGCDILILGGRQLIGKNKNYELTTEDIKRIHKTIVDAVKNGIISEKRIDQSVQRILGLKKRIFEQSQLESKNKNDQLKLDELATEKNKDLSKKIASLGLKIYKNNPIDIDNISKCELAIFAPKILKNNIEKTSIFKNKKQAFFFDQLDIKNKKNQNIIKKSDLILFFSYNAWRDEKQKRIFKYLSSTKKPIILIAARDSVDASLFKSSNLIITTFSPSLPSIKAAVNILENL